MKFSAFRIIIGLILIPLAAYLIVEGGQSLLPTLFGTATGSLSTPVVHVLGGLFVLVFYWWTMWSASSVHRSLENIFSIPELVKKLAFTLGLLCIYRIGFHVPLPGLDQQLIMNRMAQQSSGVFGQAMEYYAMLTGGRFSQATLFGLGIMPYISASIIFQLMATVVPALEKLQKEGPVGQKKIQEYTRYATIVLCLVQAMFWMRMNVGGGDQGSVYIEYRGSIAVMLMGVFGLTAGTIFLMWLGEQIDEYGIGNGISLLIMAGIVARLPIAVTNLMGMTDLSITGVGASDQIGPLKLLVLAAMFVFVVAGAILITQGQRRIPIQQARHVRGRRVTAGGKHFMPLRVNHGGVMPIIFASSLLMVPGAGFRWLQQYWPNSSVLNMMAGAFDMNSYTYAISYIALIFFFAYFWTTVQFKPKEMSEQLRDMGHFIPGLRPGRRTSEYLERVMERITYCGAAFLSFIAVLPMVVSNIMGIPYGISAFLGGTGLLITISVGLDLVQRIEANLVMRNYGGFLGGSTRIKGAYS